MAYDEGPISPAPLGDGRRTKPLDDDDEVLLFCMRRLPTSFIRCYGVINDQESVQRDFVDCIGNSIRLILIVANAQSHEMNVES